MTSGRAVPWKLWAGVVAIAIASPSGLAAMQGAAGGAAVPQDCKCTRKAVHERHDNLVALLTFKPKDQQNERDDVPGSMVWLCKHTGANIGQDRVAWLNLAKARYTIRIVFDDNLWPFELPIRPIELKAGETSDYFRLDKDVKNGTYFYKIMKIGPTGKQAEAVKLMQPGPGVVADN